MDYIRATQLADLFSKVIKRQVVGHYELFDYWYADWVMFRDYPETREFRGITYDRRDGSIVSRPFHKFFNIDQVPETTGLRINGRMAEKRDGSMVQATYHKGELFVASRSSMSGYVNEQATPYFTEKMQEYMKNHPHITFLFEFEDTEHTIVLHHQQTQLIFLAARNKLTGEYEFNHDFPCKRINYSRVNESSWRAAQAFATSQRKEGWVVWVDGYGPVKWKTEWYLKSHGLLTEHTPKKWVLFWANDDIDDAVSLLRQLNHPERATTLENFASVLNEKLFITIEEAYDLCQGCTSVKDYAISMMPIRDKPFGAIVFSEIMKDVRSEAEKNIPALMSRVKRNLVEYKGMRIDVIADAYYEEG